MRDSVDREIFARALGALPALLVVACIGCGGQVSPEALIASTTDTNLKRVTKVYSMYMKNHGGQGPANAAELKAFIQRINPDQLQQMGIDIEQLDGLLLSERDQQPLKVRWGCRGGRLDPPQPVVFENTPGADGGFQVGFTGGGIEQVDQARFDALWRGEGGSGEAIFQNRR